MKMTKQNGFTLIELMVTFAIVGILFATAIPTYHTWQQRAYGSEATIMAKQIMDAQIVYFLDNDKYFPENNSTIAIYHDTPQNHANVVAIYNNLNITVPTGHFLNYTFQPNNQPGNEMFTLQISSYGGFDLFTNTSMVQYTINKRGEIWSLGF